MLVANLSQDYYGYFRQSAAPGQEPGADKPEVQRPRVAVLPAERVVEGELLRNRNKGASDALNEALQRGRFAESPANSQRSALSAHAAQRAINTYLDNAAQSTVSQGGRSRAVDYYA
jgi:hypothetical protein